MMHEYYYVYDPVTEKYRCWGDMSDLDKWDDWNVNVARFSECTITHVRGMGDINPIIQERCMAIPMMANGEPNFADSIPLSSWEYDFT